MPEKNIFLKSTLQPSSTTGLCVTIITLLYWLRRITSSAVKVFPKRILAYQSISLSFLKTFNVFSIASSCSCLKSIVSCGVSLIMSTDDSDDLPSFTAFIALLTVSKLVTNHSSPDVLFGCFLHMPEFIRTLCTSLSLKFWLIPSFVSIRASSVYKSLYSILAVLV